ncbi:MAG: hypothetical protein HFE43_09650 [Oscillospiraceae bacterium]|nr:hypothetical protein [Oscillospiraceae bacterium]
MYNDGKRILSIGNAGTVAATEPINDIPYSVTYSSEEVTDFYALLEIALNQPSPHSVRNSTISVTQLLEVREYENNIVEKDYAFTEFFLDPETALKYGVVSPSTRGSVTHSNNNIKDFSIACTLYYSARMDESGLIPLFQVSKVTSTVVKTQVTTQMIVGLTLGYTLSEDSYVQKAFSYNNVAGTGGQTFTLNCTDNGWYVHQTDDSVGVYHHGIYGYVYADASDGTGVEIVCTPRY